MRAGDDVRVWYGWAELSPDEPIVAGQLGRWRVTYHVGRYGVAAGGSLKLLFHSAADWPPLQGRDPYEENFVTVRTPGRARLAWRYDPRGHAEPWSRAVLVEVAQWGLSEGETVVFYLGDPEGGSPGVRARTAAGRDELRVVVDPWGRGCYVAVPSPAVEVVAGAAERLALVAPSLAAPGRPFALWVRVEDRWGNPARGWAGRVQLNGAAGRRSVELAPTDGGVRRVQGLRLVRRGLHRLRGRAAGLVGEANPLRVGEGHGLVPLWGDLHGQAARELGQPGDYYRFARDVAGLDFCAHLAPAGETTAGAWRALRAAVQAYDEPGRFAAFLGYHWHGSWCGGGSRLVLYADDEGALYGCGPAGVEGGEEACTHFPLPALYEALRGHEALVVVGGGAPAANLDYHDPQLEALLELRSGWGEAHWLLEEALARGRRLGLVATGGDLLGHPGASWPGGGERVAQGGLTCVYARAHTRRAIWEALRARRSYATSGPRLLLEVRCDGHAMGEAYQATRPPELTVRVAGTAEIESVQVHRGRELAYRYPEDDPGLEGWVRMAWGGSMARDWPRHLPWDGALHARGARILQAVPYGFDSPLRGLVLQEEASLSWRSLTAGNENGLLLHLEAAPDAALELHTPLSTLTVPLAAIPATHDLGGEGLFVRVEPRPRGTGQRELELHWAEPDLRPGTTPYYVTVRQVDGARAWSSPIYVLGPGA